MFPVDLTIGDVRVTSDEHNFIVSTYRIKQKGKDAGTGYWSADSYHSTLRQVSSAIAKLSSEGVKTPGTDVFDRIQKLLEDEQARLDKIIAEGIKQV